MAKTKDKITWSPFKAIEAKEQKPWKKERWYSGDVNGCMGGAYFSRLGEPPTNPIQERNARIMRMGKLMEVGLVNDIKRHFLKPMPAKKLAGVLFPRLKEVFLKKEMIEKIKKAWDDKEMDIFDKFQRGLEIFEEGWEQILFNGYTDPDILSIETQRYIRDEKLDVGLRIDLLIICKPGTKPSIIYEIKSMNSKAFWWMAKGPNGFQPKEDHVKQAHLYLYELREEIPGIEARVLYVARDDMITQECDVLYDESHAQSQVQKFELLNQCWKDKVLPPVEPAITFEGGKYGVNWKAKYCSHHGLCMGDMDWLAKAEAEVAELNASLKSGGSTVRIPNTVVKPKVEKVIKKIKKTK